MNPQVIDEADLIRRVRDGEPGAFESLYRAYVGRIYGLCLRLTGSPSLAEDCVQETMIKAWQKIDLFRGDSAFGTWLHRMAVNDVLDRQRKATTRQTHLTVVKDAARDETATPRDGGHHRIDLERAIGQLPQGARNAFVLHKVYGYSHRESAQMLGIAQGTCKAQVHRARKLLIQELEA